MKSLKIASLCFLFILVAYIIFNQAFKQGLINLNTISVRTDNGIRRDKIEIVQGYFSINRKSDSELFFEWPESQVIFRDGVGKRPNADKGETDFLVIYDNKYYFEFRHSKAIKEKNEKFNFHLMRVDSSFYLSVSIEPHGRKFKRRMNLIVDSDKLLTNKPKELAGNVYDGIELK